MPLSRGGFGDHKCDGGTSSRGWQRSGVAGGGARAEGDDAGDWLPSQRDT